MDYSLLNLMQRIVRISCFLTLFLAATLLGACATAPTAAPTPKEVKRTEEDAKQLEEAKKYSDAASTYLKLAQSLEAEQKANYQLQAAQNYLKTNNVGEAREILEMLEESKPIPRQAKVLHAQLSILDNNSANALILLNSVSLTQAPTSEFLAIYYATLAQANENIASLQRSKLTKQAKQVFTFSYKPTAKEPDERSKQIILNWEAQALDARVNLESHLRVHHDIAANQKKIWTSLSALDSRELAYLRKHTKTSAAAGWVDLVAISKQYKKGGQQKGAVARWQRNYPDHTAFPEFLMYLRGIDPKKSRHIGLILPFKSKEYNWAADSVYQGFMSAHNVQRATVPVKVYPVGASVQESISAYSTAVNRGASIIIGPLTREAILALSNKRLLPVPTVTLNVVTNMKKTPPNLYQFGLSIEDEAKQIARLAYFGGFQTAVTLATDAPMASRMQRSFAKEWDKLGGEVKAQYEFGNTAVQNIKLAEQLHSENVDMIFLAAEGKQIDKIRPLIGDRLPIFSTSRIYLGRNDSRINQLEAVRFVDQPWVLKPLDTEYLIYRPLQKPKQIDLERLYALGIDAYQLVPLVLAMPRYNVALLNGASGNITLSRDNQFKRTLPMAKIQRGEPIIEDFRVANRSRY